MYDLSYTGTPATAVSSDSRKDKPQAPQAIKSTKTPKPAASKTNKSSTPAAPKRQQSTGKLVLTNTYLTSGNIRWQKNCRFRLCVKV